MTTATTLALAQSAAERTRTILDECRTRSRQAHAMVQVRTMALAADPSDAVALRALYEATHRAQEADATLSQAVYAAHVVEGLVSAYRDTLRTQGRKDAIRELSR